MEKNNREMIVSYAASTGEGRHRIEAIAVVCGRDVALTIGGGTDYHIGAAALAVPRPSLAEDGKTSASLSIICVTGHKDDEIARQAAQSLATSLGCIVTVSAGIHVDAASSEDIRELEQNSNQVIQRIKLRLKRHYNLEQKSM